MGEKSATDYHAALPALKFCILYFLRYFKAAVLSCLFDQLRSFLQKWGKDLFIYWERGDEIMTSEEKRSWAVRQLQIKQAETGRLPLKSDFDVVTLSRIKAFLGPWPRALEAAGLKAAKTDASKKKKRSGKGGAVKKTSD